MDILRTEGNSWLWEEAQGVATLQFAEIYYLKKAYGRASAINL
jgi:hypothetical protein